MVFQIWSDPPERLSYKKDGAAAWKFKTELLRVTNIMFCGRGLNSFHI